MQCILWGENVRMVWGMSVFCEVWACEVRSLYMNSEFEVEGVRLKVWSLKSLCQVEGLRCEAFCEVKGMRLEMWSWRLKVWSMRFVCWVEGLKSTVWSVKFFVKGWRYLYVKSKVWSLRFDEVGGLSFEHSFCEVWSLRLQRYLWALTFEHSLWGLTIHHSLWNIKFELSWLFVKSKVWTFNTLCEVWALNIMFKVWGLRSEAYEGLWGFVKHCEVCETLWMWVCEVGGMRCELFELSKCGL